MKPTLNQIAVWVTLALTALATALRLATLPQVQAEAVGEAGISLWLLLALIACTVVLVVLAIVSRLPLRPLLDGEDAKLPGLAAVAAGAVLFVDTVMAMVRLILTGITPPPNAQILNPADRTTLWLTLVFGFLGGLWLVLTGIRWHRNQSLSTAERFGALLPVLWIWCRLARYELSYASATNAKRSFYDFFMLIFLTLFLLAFARYVADVAPPKARSMRAYASIAAMLGISSPLTRLGMYLLGDTESFNASQLAGATDFAIGLLALALTVYLYRDIENALDDEEDESNYIDDLAKPSTTPLSDQLFSEWLSEHTENE
ncbi:MAG: hypothetical protein IJC17_02345 [Clostridia bacterium]|nr:hypothetical protein [Clostridia bacterium]